ncbi:hypothetical protein EAG_03254 [Camponotus floridanus]|uniref:Uncharacterized protein n=1 Tax=Camponotus floridanus TaxID=104421 RepID=E2AFU2_CAMFO|nr:hypothetical protein EAG_03254 [Camponotus floridanus]
MAKVSSHKINGFRESSDCVTGRAGTLEAVGVARPDPTAGLLPPHGSAAAAADKAVSSCSFAAAAAVVSFHFELLFRSSSCLPHQFPPLTLRHSCHTYGAQKKMEVNTTYSDSMQIIVSFLCGVCLLEFLSDRGTDNTSIVLDNEDDAIVEQLLLDSMIPLRHFDDRRIKAENLRYGYLNPQYKFLLSSMLLETSADFPLPNGHFQTVNQEFSPVARIDLKHPDDGQPFGSNPPLPSSSSFPNPLYPLRLYGSVSPYDVVPRASTGVRDRLQGLFLPRD